MRSVSGLAHSILQLGFTSVRKKTEFLDKSSKIIDIFSNQSEASPTLNDTYFHLSVKLMKVAPTRTTQQYDDNLK